MRCGVSAPGPGEQLYSLLTVLSDNFQRVKYSRHPPLGSSTVLPIRLSVVCHVHSTQIRDLSSYTLV